MTLKASSPDFGAMKVTIEAGSEPPMHFHSREEEYYYVLDGELTYHVDGKVLRAGPGAFVFLPRGVPHTLTVEGTGRAEVLLMVTPGGFERMFPRGTPRTSRARHRRRSRPWTRVSSDRSSSATASSSGPTRVTRVDHASAAGPLAHPRSPEPLESPPSTGVTSRALPGNAVRPPSSTSGVELPANRHSRGQSATPSLTVNGSKNVPVSYPTVALRRC
jgi:quercetin dioxygenase-like cupin family protein